MKQKILLAALVAATMASCSNESGLVPELQDKSLRITANISGTTAARAEKLSWQDGDKLGIYVCKETLGVPYNSSPAYSNAPFTYSASGWSSDEILLDETEGTVFAYYPHVSPLSDPKAVPVDILTQTDHLYGQGDSKVTIYSRNVNITLRHALTQVVFRMKKDNAYEGEGKITAIRLENTGAETPLQTNATLDISKGALTTTKAGSIDFTVSTTLTDTPVSLSSIVIPVTATKGKDMKAVFTIDGKQLQYVFPAATVWAAGNRNIYSITLGNNGLELGGSDGSGIKIEPWTDSTPDDIQLVPVI